MCSQTTTGTFVGITTTKKITKDTKAEKEVKQYTVEVDGQVSHGLQLQSPWITPDEAVS